MTSEVGHVALSELNLQVAQRCVLCNWSDTERTDLLLISLNESGSAVLKVLRLNVRLNAEPSPCSTR